MFQNTSAPDRTRLTVVRLGLLLVWLFLVFLISYELFLPQARAAERFVPIGNAAVLDAKTSLMWEEKTLESAGRLMIWSEAQAYCRDLGLAGFRDWRLPTPLECKTLMDRRYVPAGPAGLLRFPLAWCWTAWRNPLGCEAWLADFAAGTISKADSRTCLFVRAVRTHSGTLATAFDPDHDGVLTGEDMCPETPAGVPVDSAGCPRDSDEDGVDDALDRCPDTPLFSTVGPNGCGPGEAGKANPPRERTTSSTNAR